MSDGSDLSFDLVITARDDVADISNFFSHLQEQTSSAQVRVLFADQGTGWHGDDVDTPFSVSVISTERVSVSRARNCAMSLGIRSRIVAFPDDDCWYGPSTLDQISRAFREDATIDAICTNVRDPIANQNYGKRPVELIEDVTWSSLFRLPISVGLFVKREALEQVGLWFDERLGAGTELGSGEESELVTRLLRAKKRVIYRGDISVFHLVPDFQASDAAKAKNYGRGFGYIAAKIILEGNVRVLPELCRTLIRSVGGSIRYCLVRDRRRVYASRSAGIMAGIMQAVSWGSKA